MVMIVAINTYKPSLNQNRQKKPKGESKPKNRNVNDEIMTKKKRKEKQHKDKQSLHYTSFKLNLSNINTNLKPVLSRVTLAYNDCLASYVKKIPSKMILNISCKNL